MRYSAANMLAVAIETNSKISFERYLNENPSVLYTMDSVGNHPICSIVSNSRNHMLDYLVRAGISGSHFDVRDSKGRTPLEVAFEVGNTYAFKVLIESGADINIANSTTGNTVYHHAMRHTALGMMTEARDEMLDYIRSNGASEEVTNNRGERPLDVLKRYTHSIGMGEDRSPRP